MQLKLNHQKVQLSLEHFLDISCVKLKRDVWWGWIHIHSLIKLPPPPLRLTRKQEFPSYTVSGTFSLICTWNSCIGSLLTLILKIYQIDAKLTQLRLGEFKTERKQPCIQYFFGLCLCMYRTNSCLNVQNCMHHAMFLMRLLSIHFTADDEKESYKFQKYFFLNKKKYYNLFSYFSVCKSGMNGNNSI